jgi:predicted DNA-binding protein with PD1-like motif
MKVIEAQRTRHLVLRIDRGEELPAALQRALNEAGAQSAWVEGFGTLEAAEVAVFDARLRSYAKGRRFEPGGDLVSLAGNVTQLDGGSCARLFATLARESDAGLTTVAGELLWARAFSLELHVTVFEDVSLGRVADERTGMLALVQASGGGEPKARAAATSEAVSTPRAAAPAQRANESAPSPAVETRTGMGSGMEAPQHLSPPRREKPKEDPGEVYPEVGDIANHFHFGECKIISSDGDKIRLQQLKDLRVREVALGALKTELVRQDPETNQRHFNLLRKN